MITVFYANMVYGQYRNWQVLRNEISMAETPEIYNGGFVHSDRVDISGQWYTCDGCPYPEDQIDPRLKAWLLLLD